VVVVMQETMEAQLARGRPRVDSGRGGLERVNFLGNIAKAFRRKCEFD